MNNTVKIILGLVAGAVIVCLLAGISGLILINSVTRTVGQSLQSEPVSAVAGGIADFELPTGFGEAYARQVAGFDLVAYTGQDGRSHVFFFQLPQGVHVDPDEIGRRLEQASGRAEQANRRSKVVDRLPATIRGQQTTLVVSEGSNSAGRDFRQVSAMFQGKGGQALVVFERPVGTWDQSEVDAFLTSIR